MMDATIATGRGDRHQVGGDEPSHHANQRRVVKGSRIFVWLLFFLMLLGIAPDLLAQTIRVDTTPDHATNSFRPTETLGAGIDRIPRAATDKLFTERTIKEVLSAGWQTVRYRQNTELHVEAWHWNPKGTWSEPGDAGYFVGNDTPTDSIRHSYGYPAAQRPYAQRWRWLLTADGWRHEHVLEERSVPCEGLHGRGRRSAPAMGRRRFGQHSANQCDSNRLGQPIRPALLGAILDGRGPNPLRNEGSLVDFPFRRSNERRWGPGHSPAFELSYPCAICAHLDDRIVEHMRHSRAG
jgi:hypothetical protein